MLIPKPKVFGLILSSCAAAGYPSSSEKSIHLPGVLQHTKRAQPPLALFRPNSALVPAGLNEMEPTTAGEGKDILSNLAPEIDHLLSHPLQFRMIKHYQHTARIELRCPG